MTQVFDPETGGVTPVTVIQAGPCPVVQVKTAASTATTPSSSRSTPSPTASSRSRELGHLKKFGVGAHRQARRVPRRHRRRRRGRGRHRRDLRAGRQDQGRRHRDRQGLPGHDQAPQLRLRPALARLAQHPQAGLDRRVGDAVARLQGHEAPGPHGRQARHAARADRASTSTPSTTCCSSRARSPVPRTARGGARLMAKAPQFELGQEAEAPWTSTTRCSAPRSSRTSCTRPCARSRTLSARAPRRRRAAGSSRAAARSRGARRAPAAHARARSARRSSTGGGHAFAKVPRTFIQKVNRKAAKAALRVSSRESRRVKARLHRRCDEFDKPSTKVARGLVEGVEPRGADS